MALGRPLVAVRCLGGLGRELTAVAHPICGCADTDAPEYGAGHSGNEPAQALPRGGIGNMFRSGSFHS